MARKSRQLLEFEAKHARPAEDVIVEAIKANGSVNAAARALGISHNTLFGWCWRLGIHVETVVTTRAAS